jgi:hypothetical protein
VQAIQLVDLSARCSTPMLPFPISHNRQSGLREAKAEKLATVDVKDLEMVMKQATKLTDFSFFASRPMTWLQEKEHEGERLIGYM